MILNSVTWSLRVFWKVRTHMSHAEPPVSHKQGCGAGQILDPAPLRLRLQQFFKIRLHSGSGSRQVEIFILIACGVSNKRSQKGEYIFSTLHYTTLHYTRLPKFRNGCNTMMDICPI